MLLDYSAGFLVSFLSLLYPGILRPAFPPLQWETRSQRVLVILLHCFNISFSGGTITCVFSAGRPRRAQGHASSLSQPRQSCLRCPRPLNSALTSVVILSCKGVWEMDLWVGHIAAAEEIRVGFAMGGEQNADCRQVAKHWLYSQGCCTGEGA